jgi:hypothetical protein
MRKCLVFLELAKIHPEFCNSLIEKCFNSTPMYSLTMRIAKLEPSISIISMSQKNKTQVGAECNK